MKGHSPQDINALGTTLKGKHINEAVFLAECFLNAIYVLFPLTIKLGRVVYSLTLYQLKPLLRDKV